MLHRWLLCVAAVYYSPFDWVYQSIQTPLHPLRVACRFVEAIDAYTTICGTFEKGTRLYSKSTGGPYMLAAACALGGSLHRYWRAFV